MKYYLTTPIYYVNATPHIGHAYTTLAADTIKRFRRMMGDEAYLTTGTDEHGQKVEQSAKAAGWTPQEFTDRVSDAFRREWDDLNIAYDYYRRTTDPNHAKAVQEIFTRCKDNGAIYKASYTGKYSVTDEMFVTDEEAEKLDPEKVVELTEENYFFKLSAYQDKLLELYRNQPDFIEPESRRNEVLAFVEGGLKDLSISRSSLKWGIPMPDDEEHVFYVWFDALTTYMSAIGYGEDGKRRENWEKLWPADVHVIGKEILRFHAVYWPAFLMAAELPLPKKIYAHGWLIFQEEKMSKSKGNIVRSKPIRLAMGADALRYYLLSEIHFGQDGAFSYEALVKRYNADLANGIGNLVSRTVTMVHKYHGGEIPALPAGHEGDFPAKADETIRTTLARYEKFEFSKALEAVWSLLGAVDKYIVEQKPWNLAKSDDAESKARLEGHSLQLGRGAAHRLRAGLPSAARDDPAGLGDAGADERRVGVQVGGPLLGRFGGRHEARRDRSDLPAARRRKNRQPHGGARKRSARRTSANPRQARAGPEAAEAKEALVIDTPEIQIDDFFKVDMRVGLVIAARKHPNADKLLHLTIDIGEAEPRSICAGIAGSLRPRKVGRPQSRHRRQPQASQDARHRKPGHDHRRLGRRPSSVLGQLLGGRAHRRPPGLGAVAARYA